MRVEALDQLVLDALEAEVLTEDRVAEMIRDGAARLASAPADAHAAERARLDAELADLDRKIRRAAAQVLDGLIDDEDARAITAPLRARREQARLELATLPTAAPVPQVGRGGPDAVPRGGSGGLAGATDAGPAGCARPAHRGDPGFTRRCAHLVWIPSP